MRGISTVVDVSIALLLCTAAVAVMLSMTPASEYDDEQRQADVVASTVTSTTVDANYSVEGPVENTAVDSDEYDRSDRQRVTHGPVGSHLAKIAVSNVRFDEGDVGIQVPAYEREIEDALFAVLGESQLYSNISAVWDPVGDGSVRGSTALGGPVPDDEQLSTSTLTVPSGFDSIDASTVDSTESPDFDAIADSLATTVVEGFFPPREAEQALERSGLDRDLTVYRYEQFFETLALDSAHLDPFLEPSRANTTKLNGFLVDGLSAYFEPRLKDQFDDAAKAATAIEVDTVTITVRTWEP